MTSAFKGVALLVWSRHRRGIVAVAIVYLAAFFAYDTLWALEGKPFVGLVLTFLRGAPFFVPLFVLTSAVSLATTDLATRDSWYPRQLFTLPLTTHQLVLPFMSYTVGLYALLWIAAIGISDGRVIFAGPLELPTDALRRQVWDPFLHLGLLVWVQAVVWRPFRRRWSRIIVLFGLVAAYFAVLIPSIAAGFADSTIIAFCLAQVPAAYFVGVRGVARARCDGVEQVSRRQGRRREPAKVRRPFASALDAQRWFEANVQRTRGTFMMLFLMSFVLLVVLLDSLMGPEPNPATNPLAYGSIGILILTLVLVGMGTGPAFATFDAKPQFHKGEAFRMPSFFAALPLSTGDFAWAKLKTASKRMALMAAIVLAAAVGIAAITGIHESWAGFFAVLREQHGALEAGVLVALAAIAFLLFAAAATASLVWTALLGRRWSVASNVFAFVIIGIVVLSVWIGGNPDRVRRIFAALPTVLPILAAVKLVVLASLAYVVGSRRLYDWSRIARIGAAWLAAVVVCFLVYVRYVPDGVAGAGTVLSTLVVLAPILGIVAAPLALQWNRCR